jgi:hypothetical protein
MRHDAQRGSGRIGLLIALIVVGVAAFLGLKIIPVRITAYEFLDVLREEARMAAVRKGDSAISARIIKRAHEMDVPLDARNLQVQRTGGEMIIRASYEQPIDLKVTTYVYRFKGEGRAPLF